MFRKTSAAAVLAAVLIALLAGCATTAAPVTAGGTAATATASSSASTAVAKLPAAPLPVAIATATAAPGAGPAAGAATPAVSPSGAAAAPPARPAEPGALRPFAEVVRDAREARGFITVWTKDERTWLEIRPEQLERPFFYGYSLASGLGEFFVLPGLTGTEHMAVLRRVGNTLQLVARNLRVRGPAGTPLETALRESYSDSLLASAPVVSAPHAERKSFLVDAAVLFGADLPGAQTALEMAYRIPYAFDRNNSSIERTRATEGGTYLTLRKHYAIGKLPAPPLAPAPPGTPTVLPPNVLPDNRSLFLTFAYTLAPLPDPPMRPRQADPRVGHFTTAFLDFGNIASGNARTHFVERWRLEKKDPAAAVSEPREPIVVWMDRNVPEDWRPVIREAILEWNKAFERAGFRNAIDVRQQPADADWSTLEGTRHIAMRWFAMMGPNFVAVGPSQADPRTGEILRGAAIVPENWVRLGQSVAQEEVPQPSGASPVSGPAASLSDLLDGRACTLSADAINEAAFGMQLLAASGDLQPGSPEARRIIEDNLRWVVMHEVGHALGLRHNFRASSGVKFEQLRDAAQARSRGLAHSVMDYIPFNLPLQGEPASVYSQVTLGEYDYWAIEYAYRELPAEREAAELAAIAGRARTNPALAYATDEDLSAAAGGGIDPLVNAFDLGDDPLAYYQRRIALSRELWARTQARQLGPEESFALYRRNLQRGLNQVRTVTPLIAKYVGGVNTVRDVPGGDRPLLAPVPAAQQRAALQVLAREVFAADSFRFDPGFMSRLGVEQLDRTSGSTLDFSLASAVLGIQRAALDALMSDGVAARLADAETKVADRRSLMTLAEVQDRLHEAIWSELKTGRNIDSLRRNLQRDHARRLAAGLVRPATPVAADVRAVNRQSAVRLRRELQQAMGRGTDAITRAHLAETLAMLDEALKASLVKAL
ncbi:MAG: zinc-dependent metalloprotease [Betaproteobacteria bacterium]